MCRIEVDQLRGDRLIGPFARLVDLGELALHAMQRLADGRENGLGIVQEIGSVLRQRVARVSNVYGPDFYSDNFLPSIVRQAVSGEKLVLHTAAESAKDYISVDDVVNALIQIATRGREQIYNVATGVNVSHRELADGLRALTDCEIEFVANAPVASFPPIDIERMRSEFGFAPRSVLDDLPQLVESYKRAAVK